MRTARHLEARSLAGPPKDSIDPSELNKTQRKMLKDSFSVISELQDLLAKRYGLDQADKT